MNIEEKYEKIINYFKDISNIPRNSKHEEKIAEYLCKFARDNNLYHRRDKYNNVVIFRNATEKMKDKKTILFQAHTDMVCVKKEGSNHDFEVDPIKIIDDGKTLRATDTTLGADDGIGVAFLMFLLTDKEIEIPNIECLFTTQEEIGMDGAREFEYYNELKADYLINLDGEEENTAIVGCAGGVSVNYSKVCDISDLKNEKSYILNIDGLFGGHSGVDIDKNRINSNYLAAKLLKEIDDLRIISWKGGTKDNAIANSTQVIFATKEKSPIDFMSDIIENLDTCEEDMGLLVSVHETKQKARFMAMSKDNSFEIIKLILGLKQDVIKWSKDIEGLVETSGNIGIVRIDDGKIKIIESLRSSIDSQKEEIKEKNNQLAKSLGFNIIEEGEYPGWKYNPNSKIEKVYKEAYKRTHDNQEPIVCAIHAGVECGMIYEKLPRLDMISLGPDVKDVHTVNETLYLESCKKMLETLIEIINRLD